MIKKAVVSVFMLVLLTALSAAEPEIVVAFNQMSQMFGLRSIKRKPFYSMLEAKFIPLYHYDSLVNLRTDFMEALSADKRARWREATPEDSLDFATLWDEKNPPMPPNLKADAVLLVFVSEYGADPGDYVYIGSHIKMLDRRGKKMWNYDITQMQPIKKTVAEWIREDPAKLKAVVNSLEEQAVKAAMEKIAKAKVKP
jgi:hypothetical protein